MTHLSIHPPAWFWLSLAIGLALALGTLWFYTPQLAALGRPWRTLLPGLRLAALAALAASVLRPTVLRPRTPAEQGAVVILEDASRSMSVIDASGMAQTLDVAEALGLLGQRRWDVQFQPLSAAVDALRSAHQAARDARGDLEYARLAGRGLPQAEERDGAAAERVRAAATDVAAKASTFASARPLTRAAHDLLDLVNGRPESWLGRPMDELVDRILQALDSARNGVADELLRNDEVLRQASRDVASMSRRQIAERAIVSKESGLLAALDPQTPVYAFSFGEALSPFVPRAQTASAQTSLGGASPARQLEGDPRTDLAGALAEVAQRLRGQEVRSIVLFSDGRQVGSSSAATTESAPASAAAAAATMRAPVLAVQCARGPLRDRSIIRSTSPTSVFAGESATVRVEVRSIGLKEEAVDVALVAPGVDRQVRRVDLADDRAATEFPLKLTNSGVQRINVSVAPSGAEVTDQNNRVERLVKVLSGKINVALVSSSPTWEYQYLRNALARTPFVRLSDTNLLSVSDDSTARGWAMTPERIVQQDVIILCDVSPHGLSSEQWSAVRRAVTEQGRSLVLLAGQESAAADGPLAELLPWAATAAAPPGWQIWPGEEAGFHIVPGVEGQEVESLRLADDPAANRKRWAELPGLFRYFKLPAIKPSVRKLLIERTSNDPLLTEQRVGLGRVFFVATDETWRWRYRAGERDHDRFWIQLARYASEEPYAVENGGVALDADPVTAEPGGQVRVRARLLDESGAPLSLQQPPVIEVVRGDGTLLRSQPLEPSASSAGRYHAQLGTLPEGQYTLRLRAAGVKPDQSPAMAISIAANDEAELADLSPDDQNLGRIASASGGEVLALAALRSLPQRLATVHKTARPVEYRLWDSPYLFLLVLGCLGTEWAVRKRVGLA